MAELLPWSQRAREILADGEWHPYREVAEEAGKLIPPGMALRKREEARLDTARRQGYPANGIRPQRSDQFNIDTGRRVIMRGVLAAGRVGPTFEYKDVDGVKYIRLKGEKGEQDNAG